MEVHDSVCCFPCLQSRQQLRQQLIPTLLLYLLLAEAHSLLAMLIASPVVF